MLPKKAAPSHEEKSRVLTKAFINLSSRLELSRQELTLIVGLSAATLSRIFTNSQYHINPLANDGQLVILLLRLYRSLDALFGGNQKQCQQWLRTYNSHLNGEPIKIIFSIEGLVTVVHYLDAIRGKN